MNSATTRDSVDFYWLEVLFDADEQAVLHSVCDFMASEVEPTVSRQDCAR
jgi:hypothetical protein